MSATALHEAVTSLARTNARHRRLSAALRVVAVFLAALTVHALLDAMLGLSPEFRWIALFLSAGAALAVVTLLLAPIRAREGAQKRAAMALDEAAGGGDAVLCAWELSRRRESAPTPLQRSLIDRCVARGVGMAGQAVRTNTVDAAPLKRSAGVALALGALAVAVEAALPGLWGATLRRIADPAHFHPPWTEATFVVRTDPVDPLVGDDVTLLTAISGGAGPVELVVVVDRRARPRILDVIPLGEPGAAAGALTATLRDVREPTHLIVRRGKAMSQSVTIDPIPAPRITHAHGVATGAAGTERAVALSLDSPSRVTVGEDERVRIELETTLTPSGVRAEGPVGTALHEFGATIAIDASAGSRRIALTPIGPTGLAAPNPLTFELVVAAAQGEAAGATDAGSVELAEAAGDLAAGEMSGAAGATGETTGASGQAAEARDETPTIAQGAGEGGPNRVARDSARGVAEIDALAAAEARRAAAEIMTAGAPEGDAPIALAGEIPERYRLLAARFFKRIIRDERAPEGNSP